jgi:hypothetical protein
VVASKGKWTAKIDLGAPEGTTVNGWTFWRYIDPYNNEEIFIDNLRNEKVG